MSGEQELESAEQLAAVHSFHDLYAHDAEAGTVRPRMFYEDCFPDHREIIAREYGLLVPEGDAASILPSAPAAAGPLGPYRLIRELGRGGQGIVWLAEDARLRRRVALKVLPPGLGFSGESLRRFQREAEIASRVEHAGICPIHEVGQDHGVPYIAMRYVEGETLGTRLAREKDRAAGGDRQRQRDAGPEDSRPAADRREEALGLVTVIEKAARAVHAAHEAGVLHRDLKPGNIMVTPEGEPVVLDFGLAGWLDDGHSLLTRSGDVFGTPPYMAPEQLRKDGVRADRRTDVYALGATLYECLTLRRPFEAPTREATYHRILTADPTFPPEVFRRLPRELLVVVATALEKDPDRRYQTAGDLAEDLRRVREREPIRARRAGWVLRMRRWVERNRVLAAAMFIVFLLLSTGLAISLALLSRVRDGYDRARALGLVSASIYESGRDQMLGLLLAREAVRVSPDPTTRSQLRNALAVTRERAIIQASGLVNFAWWSPDRTRIAAGSHQAFIWDAEEYRPILLGTRGNSILHVAFSRDGRQLATLSGNFGAILWGFEDGAPVHVAHLPAATGMELGGARWNQLLCFSPTEDLLFVGQESGVTLAFDAHGEKHRSYGLGSTARVVAVACSPLGDLLAIGREDGSASIVPIDGRDEGVPLAGHAMRITCLEFSRSGDMVASGSMDGTVRVWSRSGEPLADPIKHGAWITSVAFAPDGGSLLVACEKQDARLWDLSGNLLRVYQGHVGSLSGACFSPDGSRVLTCANDATARVFTLDGRETAVLRGHEDRVTTAVFSSAGDRVLTASWDGTVRLWDVQAEGFPTLHGHAHAVFAGTWSHGGDRIATASVDRTTMLWDLSGRGRVIGRYLDLVDCVAFSPDDRRLLTGTRDGCLEIRDLDSEEVTSWNLGTETCDASFDGPGDRLLVATRDHGLQILDANGERTHLLEDGRHFVAAAFSPDGRLVLGGRGGRFPVIWNPESGDVRTLGQGVEGHTGPLWDAAFAPSGRLVATCSADGTARVWDLEGRPLEVFRHEGRTNRVAFSPDSRLLATTSMDGTARIWDVRGGEIAMIRAGAAIAWDVAFSPDGSRLLVTYSDWTARVWPVSDDDVLDLALRRITRDFTSEERARYAGLLEGR